MTDNSYLFASNKHLQRRHKANQRFKFYGIFAIAISFIFLGTLLTSIVSKGYTAFWKTEITLPITFSQEILDPKETNDPVVITRADFNKLIRTSLKEQFPEVKGRRNIFQLYGLISKGAAYTLKDYMLAHPEAMNKTIDIPLTASADIDMFMKGYISEEVPQSRRKVKDNQIAWIKQLEAAGAIHSGFSTTFFSAGDSREPEQSGVLGSIIGSIFTVLVCMFLAFPLAVLTAVYLEEFAPKNPLTEFIEVNINNLAAVPSIVFGLLGLAVYLSWLGLPRSSSLAAGLTLALMVLPTIVITTRHALKAVPPSIRDGARALGASPMQVVLHHTLPLAMPGIMTGTILSIARVLGETAPLLMIGMVAFIADIPAGFTDPATVMPVQIYLWADSPELAFVERTSAAIMVLLAFLIAVNALAVYLRKRFEHRW